MRRAEEDGLPGQLTLHLRLTDGLQFGDGRGETLLFQRGDAVREGLDVISNGAGAALAGQRWGQDSHSPYRRALINDGWPHIPGINAAAAIREGLEALEDVDVTAEPQHPGADLLALICRCTHQQDLLPEGITPQPPEGIATGQEGLPATAVGGDDLSIRTLLQVIKDAQLLLGGCIRQVQLPQQITSEMRQRFQFRRQWCPAHD